MTSDTQTISIHAHPQQVLEFIADPAQLPRWAVGFAKAIRRESERWIVTTAGGEMGVRIVTDQKFGVVDFYLSPAPGVEALAASRVIPNGPGAEYVFTQFQAPGMADDAFAQSVRTLAHELTVLKALLEVECPS